MLCRLASSDLTSTSRTTTPQTPVVSPCAYHRSGEHARRLPVCRRDGVSVAASKASQGLDSQKSDQYNKQMKEAMAWGPNPFEYHPERGELPARPGQMPLKFLLGLE